MTTLICLNPPFDAPDVLSAILTGETPHLSPAVLPGYDLAGDGGIGIGLVPSPHAAVEGH